MTVREFIHTHPGADIEITTPKGHVYLDGPQLRKLAEGKAVIVHPGDLRRATLLPAERLLEQEVCSAYFSHGCWNVASSYDFLTHAPVEHQTGMMRWRLS